MIIEAGYDVGTLILSKLFTKVGTQRKTKTWVIAMDENLRYLYTAKVGGDASEPVGSRIPNIVKALNKRPTLPVAYYVLAHLDTDLHASFHANRNSDECAERDLLDDTLRRTPELAAHELLGIYLSSGGVVCGTLPRYSFRDYPLLKHLPRTAIIPGPHDYQCSCVACTRHEEMLQRNWERNRERNPATKTAES